MSDRLRVFFAVLAGYYLGRRRKVRMAAALAAAGLAGRASGGGGGGPLAQGVKALGSTVELQQLTDRLRGELIEVGKAAALTAASRQIDSLSQRLQDRAATLGGLAPDEAAEQQEATGEEEDYDEGAYEEEGHEEAAEKKARHGRTRARPFRRVSQSRR